MTCKHVGVLDARTFIEQNIVRKDRLRCPICNQEQKTRFKDLEIHEYFIDLLAKVSLDT